MTQRPWLDAYPADIPATIDQAQVPTLVQLLNQAFIQYADRTALHFMGARFSYRQVDQYSMALAAYLQTLSLVKGDRVALMMPNVPQYAAAVAAVLRAGLGRPHDLAARYGGEEFVCLLPDCGPQDARAKAQELCQAVRSLGLAHSASPVAPVVTLSAGVACLVPDERNSPEALLALADANLYRAKSAGRDRVDQGVETLQLQ